MLQLRLSSARSLLLGCLLVQIGVLNPHQRNLLGETHPDHSQQEHHLTRHSKQSGYAGNNTVETWLAATTAILLISLCGVLGVLLIPLIQMVFYQPLLQFLVAMAVGTLSGDALLHLFPHALQAAHQDEDGHRRAVWLGLTAAAALICFFLLERLISQLGEAGRGPTDLQRGEKEKKMTWVEDGKEIVNMAQSEVQLDLEIHRFSHRPSAPRAISSSAWMVILGDGVHNLVEGLTIGVAFASSGLASGVSTSLAVLCHELPHEIGDFAMLLRAGMPWKQALCYNLLSSVLALLGTAAGILLGTLSNQLTSWLFSATAGIDLYVALVVMAPELSTRHAPRQNWAGLLLHTTGILAGVSILLVTTLYETELCAGLLGWHHLHNHYHH